MPYKKITGIYRILNSINGKLYIGSAVSINSRFTSHRQLLKSNKHFNIHLQTSWNKYGEENFQFDIVEVTTLDLLQEREEFYIKFFNSNDRTVGYNNRLNCATNLGIKHSDETKKKLSISHLGHKRSKEAQIKISNSQHKKVCQIDLDGKHVKTFDSMKQVEEMTGIKRQLISMCCRKVIPWAKKFYWCYEQDLNTFKKLEIKTRTGGWINGIREKRNGIKIVLR